jgi:portal protein
MAGYGSDSDDKPKKATKRQREQILEDARKRFKLVLAAESQQRKNELEDLRFQDPEQQWTSESRREREGNQNAGGVPIPPRPIVSVDKLAQPRAQILNQARQAHLGIEIHPRSVESSDDTAEVQRGLYRKIEVDSKAQVARMWALDRASQCGRGYYRVCSKYDEDGENPFNQVLSIERIMYQDSVYFDPSATRADNSDARWCFVAAWLTEEEYKAQFPKAELPTNRIGWEALEKNMPEWVRVGDERPLLVAEHWYKETVKEKIRMLDDGTVLREESDQIPEGTQVIAEREIENDELHYCKLSACEVVEGPDDFPIPFIPIITVIGKELQPWEGNRRWIGIVRNAREPQRAYNWAFSSVIERAALEPKAPFIATYEQIEGHEAMWEQANTRNFPVLYYNAVGPAGNPLPAPERMQVGTGSMSVAVELVQMADHAVQASTAMFDPSLGRTNQKEQSGKAIMALQQQGDLVTSDYTANLAEISMTYEGKVILAWMPIVYDTPGRVVHILDMEGQTKPVMLNAPYAQGPGGQMRRLPPQQPGAPPPIGNPGEQIKHFDLRKGQYTANITVGRAKDTLRLEANQEIGQILQNVPDLLPVLGPIYYKNQDFPGHAEIAELLLEMREQKYPGLGKKEQGPDPKQLQAQLQQQGEQMKQMDGALKQASEEIRTKRAEQEAKVRVAEIEAQAKFAIAEREIAAKILIARINSKNETENQAREDEEERIALQQELTHEASLQSAEQAHQAMMAQQQHQQGMEQGQMGHEQTMEQAEQSAALQPPPQEGE